MLPRPTRMTARDMANRNADVNDPKRLEAEIRAAMWHHSQITPRGFDSVRDRAKIHAEIDDLLDRWAISRLMIALENA